MGGSISIDEINLLSYVKEHYQVIDRDSAKSPEERLDLMRKALLCDTFLMSANAISEDGQLVNIDGNGNRVAAMIYGPKNVIIIAGMNKVVKTLDDAYARARNIAALALYSVFLMLKHHAIRLVLVMIAYLVIVAVLIWLLLVFVVQRKK